MLGSASLLLFGTVSLGAADEPMTKERVLVEYPKALKALEAGFTHVSGTEFSTPIVDHVQKVAIRRSRRDFAVSGVSGFYSHTYLEGFQVADPGKKDAPKAKVSPSFQTVRGTNDKYSFVLGKQTPTSDYVVIRKDADTKKIREELSIAACQHMHMTCMGSMPILNLLADSGFHLERISENPLGSPRGTLKLEFTVDVPKDFFTGRAVPFRARIVSGWILVSPQDGWVMNDSLVNYITADSKKYAHTHHIDYAKGPDGKLVPSKATFRAYEGHFETDPAINNPNVIPMAGTITEIVDLKFGERPASDFTLGAFGLPEDGKDSLPPPPVIK